MNNLDQIKEIFLPYENEKDLEEVPDHIRGEMTFHFVKDINEILDLAFVDGH